MNKVILASGAALLAACAEPNDTEQKMTYPETRMGEVVDNYFGTDVPDPYRWLEDDLSEETGNWVAVQNEVTDGYLEKIPYREALRARLEKLWNYEKVSAPFNRGKHTYFYKNDGLQNQSVLYRQEGEGEPEEFLDPNKFSADGTTSLAGVSFTKDGSMVAYQISEGGSDWRKVIILNTETMERVEDTLVDVKFSGISWRGNEGFYYSSYEKPEEGSALSGMTDQHRLFFHKMGTHQSDDALIFGGAETPRRYIGGGLTEDERYLIISAAISTTGNELYVQDLSVEGSKIVAMVDHVKNSNNAIYSKGDLIYIETNMGAPNNRVMVANIANPTSDNWTELIAETKNPLSAGSAGGTLFASYLKDATSMILQYDLEGQEIRKIDLPDIGSASGFGGREDDGELYYSFTNSIYPSTIFKLNIETGESELYKSSGVDFDPSGYESKQVFYESKDGTKVPMIITHKKGVELDGTNPTMLYGYGGFNISLTPYFSTSNIVWLENGGIYAVANLRGGGEYGEEWHLAGTQMKKQNVFDDFIAAAEYLIENKYTSSSKLAIHGGSNGGLLVGAVMAQRPELMSVAIPAVGVLDMLRYHKFTAGAGWAYDYGTSEDNVEMFEYLKAYSPVHALSPGGCYPATMVMTGDHDDRVVPAHSFKFGATLQAAQGCDNPTLLRIETNAGHGAGKPTSMIIQEQADKWAFSFWNMGIQNLPTSK